MKPINRTKVELKCVKQPEQRWEPATINRTKVELKYSSGILAKDSASYQSYQSGIEMIKR